MKRSSRGVFSNETLRDIGARIKEVRGTLTQEEFAKKVGVGRTVLANYEAGRRLPDSATMENIADIGAVTTNYLLTGLEAERDPFTVDEIYLETHLQEGFALALFVYGLMQSSFAEKTELERLSIWGAVIPKLAQHFQTVIFDNVAINNSDWTTEAEALINELRETDHSAILELMITIGLPNR